jgi:aldose 1-epimerase
MKFFDFVTKSNLRVTLCSLGASVNSLSFPDKNGKAEDIVLTPKNPENNPAYLGATCGRYANRIEGGKFPLNDKIHALDKNENENTLHGGSDGIDKKNFEAKEVTENSIEFVYESPAGEMGFPANILINIKYTVKDNFIEIEQTAAPDEDTVLNLTNHTYWNLSGNHKADILGHSLKLNADKFVPVNSKMIPTGEILEVDKTPFDFRVGGIIKNNFNLANEQLKTAKGFDHYFFANPSGAACTLRDNDSKRTLRIFTDQLGLQLYTGNHLSGVQGKTKTYDDYDGVAIETGLPANCPNQENFPPSLVKKGEIYRHKTMWVLEAK